MLIFTNIFCHNAQVEGLFQSRALWLFGSSLWQKCGYIKTDVSSYRSIVGKSTWVNTRTFYALAIHRNWIFQYSYSTLYGMFAI